MLLLKVFAFFILCFIAWQDFKFRAVYWWLFLLLIIALGVVKSIEASLTTMWVDFIMNSCFLVVQLIFLIAYFSIKQKRFVNIFNELFGLGDLLFLWSVAIYFSFFNYIIFYIVSLLVVILFTLFSKLFLKNQSQKIPLAGEQALLFLLLMLTTICFNKYRLTSDVNLFFYHGF